MSESFHDDILLRLTQLQAGNDALREELARARVCVGYIDEVHLIDLRKNDYLQYPEVSPVKGGVYVQPIYIDPLEPEIAQEE